MDLQKTQDVETMTVESGQSVLVILDRTGDTKLIWSRDNHDEIENARRTFKDLKAKGYDVFRVEGKEGKRGELMGEFDPEAERLIAAPRMRGG